jgi:hypothetical protein
VSTILVAGLTVIIGVPALIGASGLVALIAGIGIFGYVYMPSRGDRARQAG